jgi:hypothetical protein
MYHFQWSNMCGSVVLTGGEAEHQAPPLRAWRCGLVLPNFGLEMNDIMYSRSLRAHSKIGVIPFDKSLLPLSPQIKGKRRIQIDNNYSQPSSSYKDLD